MTHQIGELRQQMPKETKLIVNVYIASRLPDRISAGSIGRYKFCIESRQPRLEDRYGILNIKDGRGQKYYSAR
jgi:hypothetical protein